MFGLKKKQTVASQYLSLCEFPVLVIHEFPKTGQLSEV